MSWGLVSACARSAVRAGVKVDEDGANMRSVRDLIGTVQDAPSWDRAFMLASNHGVMPLLCDALNRVSRAGVVVPDYALSAAHAESADCARRSLELSGRLLDILAVFEADGIPAMAFKGPALASMLYDNVGLREFTDLDILVRPEDTRRATELLVARGFHTNVPREASREAAYLAARHELHFASPELRVALELHQGFVALYHSVPFDYKGIWHRLGEQSFFGRRIRALAREDLLIALAVHGTKHMWARLGWICDIGRLLHARGDELRWPIVLAEADRLGVHRMLRVALLLTNRVLAIEIPDAVRADVQADPTAERLARRVAVQLEAGDRGPTDFGEHAFFVQTRERLRHKVAYLLRLAFTPTEEDRGSGIWALGASTHAVRVATKYGLRSLRGLHLRSRQAS